MTLLYSLLYDAWSYGLATWIGFAALAFCATRYLGCFGLLLSGFLVAVAIGMMDVHWIWLEMHEHPENGRDADAVFMVGVTLRVILFNVLLLPMSVLGLRLFARLRPAKL